MMCFYVQDANIGSHLLKFLVSNIILLLYNYKFLFILTMLKNNDGFFGLK